MAKSKPKKPHGFSISRSGAYFVCKWKKGSGMGNNNYSDQKFEYYWAGGWHSVSCGAKTFSKSIWVNLDNSSSQFRFRVKAKWGGDWHGWYYADAWPVYAPTLYASGVSSVLAGDSFPKTNCSWAVSNVDDTGHYIFRYVQYRSIIVKSSPSNVNSVTWGNTAWVTNSGSSGTIPYQEDSSGWTQDGYTYTRWFQVIAYGPGGKSTAHTGNVTPTAYHTYSQPPMVENVTANIIDKTGVGHTLRIGWESTSSFSHPIDFVTPKYAIVNPDTIVTETDTEVKTAISCPNSASWTSLSPIYDVSGKAGITVDIPSTIADNSCIYVMLDSSHDAQNGNPNGVVSTAPVFAEDSFKRLTEPSAPLVTPPEDPEVPLYTVTVQRNPAHDAINGVFLAVYYRLKSNPDLEAFVGVIPYNDVDMSADVMLPQLAEGEIVSLGVKAYVANYTPKSPTSSEDVTIYSTSEEKAESMIAWGEQIPLPPTLTLLPYGNNNDALEVVWNWTWTEATDAELSWSDNPDAWDSTDQPSTFEVTHKHKGRWIITGLSVGEWFVKIRLLKKDGDNTTYGTYSGRYSYSLSKSPDTPFLWVSNTSIPKNGSFICSWAYASNDGTPQQSARIVECTYDNQGRIIYSDTNLVVTGSQQHATIYAADLIKNFNWNPGELHYIALSVTAASGEKCDGWSNPVGIRIVEEVSGYIQNHNLELETEIVEIDGPITFELVSDHLIARGTPEALEEIADAVFTLYGKYVKTTDTSIVSGKNYYIKVSGLYSKVANPVAADLGNYYEVVVDTPPRVTPVADRYVGNLLVQDDPEMVPTFSLANGNLELVSPEEPITRLYLTKLPLYVQVIGAGNAGTTNIVIERSEPYHVDRPDESVYDGFEGETIAIKEIQGEGTIEIDKEDLIGFLDDGAQYRIVATITDSYGQVIKTDKIPIGEDDQHVMQYTDSFMVKWEEQAHTPSGSFTFDEEQKIALLSPVASPNSNEEDVCDIYRLSADTPELIMPDAIFGDVYVDPYPTLGKEFSGYRFVCKTKFGDYIDNSDPNEMPVPAWIDLDQESDPPAPYLDMFGIVIDFEEDQVILPYNVDVSHSWKKDFETTKYLGGSVQGDWNPTVERTSTINTVTCVTENPETIRLMRKLADYSGLCHVRTPDGSSFPANVDVSETRNEKWVTRLANFSLNITRVDQAGYDGMSYAEWISGQEG